MKVLRQQICLILSVFVFSSAAQNTDSLKLVLKNAKHDTSRCAILSILSETAPDEEWPQFTEQLKTFAEQNLGKINSDHPLHKFYSKHLGLAYNNLGYLHSGQGNNARAIEYHEKSVKIFEQIGDRGGLATSFINLGQISYMQGDVDKALEYDLKSLKLRNEINDKRGAAQALNNIALIHNSQGDIPRAIEYWSKSLKTMEEIGDKKETSNLLANMGGIYLSQGDHQKALELYEKCLQLKNETGDKRGSAVILNNIGFIFKSKGEYLKAIEFWEKSLAIQRHYRDKSGIARSLNNIGFIYAHKGDLLIEASKQDSRQAGLSKALNYYNQSLKIYEEIGDKEGITMILNNLGALFLEQKNYPKALEHCNRSLALARELGFPNKIRDAAGKLSDINSAMGNHDLALQNYKLYIRMRDSVNNTETQKAAIKQQAQYEFDKKKAIEDERHAAELKVQNEKAQAGKKRQNIVTASVSVVLLLVAFFSILLFNRFKTTEKQKAIIEIKEKETHHQKQIIEEKQKEIIDSINYARRIQYTLLAHDEFLSENLTGHFTLFKPKDIVSGDFYWATKQNNKFYLAVCDSTGHGVPGAFMSLLNIGFLSEAINEKGIETPDEIFNYVRMKLTETISRDGQKDGFDGIILCFDKSDNTITYAAANNPPVIIQHGELIELNKDRMPVGVGERKESFTLHTIEAKQGDILYLYTDGYADQFGGEKGKKFKYKQLNDLLLSVHTKSLSEQKLVIQNAFDSWKGNLEQVDDVCIIGIKLQ